MAREIFLSAGEASGDLRGAELIRSLRELDPTLKFFGMGGPKMKEGGMEVLVDVSDLAVVGYVDVIKHYPTFKKAMGELLVAIRHRKPAAVVGVDYPGFNLRLLKRSRQDLGSSVKIIQYISPQLWAWKAGRKWEMARYLDLVLCLFPFEPELYRETGLKAVFVGHPMVRLSMQGEEGREGQLVAVFPGSRGKEIRNHMPVLMEWEACFKRSHPGGEVRYAASSEQSCNLIQSFHPKAQFSAPDELQRRACVGVVCSGTATLEAAMRGLPICVIYKVAWATYVMGKMLIKVPFLAMPNVLLKRELVREFLQSDLTSENLGREIDRLLSQLSARMKIRQGYLEIRKSLGDSDASKDAAREILNML